MLKYLKNSQIDYHKWDACVEASSQRIIYALSWYLDVVAFNWAGLVEEQDNQYIIVMPLPQAKKFGIEYIYQPFFCQQLGIFSRNKETDYTCLFALLIERYRHISKFCFNTANAELHLSTINGIISYKNYTHHLDLSLKYEQIRKSYTRVCKNNIRGAQEAGLTIIRSVDYEPLIQMFKINIASQIVGGVAEETYNILRKLFKENIDKGLGILLYTRTKSGEIDAGCFFLIYANKIIYLFNAASKSGRQHNGRSLMIDSIIQEYAGKPYILDFESPINAPSIIRFYSGFGAEPVPFYSVTYNNLPQLIKFIKQARQFIYQKFINKHL